ncbi:MAG TPA: lycopene cyclase domain-containing protein [Spirochaetia bacterium]|nr:lycopene cyclase domain-containing protein [Spirochaetia bacterium]
MSLYLILDLAILFVPLVLSFDRRVAFYRRWPSAIVAIVIVGGVFIAWDVFATRRGDWSFNPAQTGELRIWGLPLEEMLFFLTAPYACLFVYEVVRAYTPEIGLFVTPWMGSGLGIAFIAAGLFFYTQPYTLTVLVVFGLFFLLASAVAPHLLMSSWFWTALGICYLPILFVDGVLTAIPVVLYGPSHIWGVRVYTIPLEDFFYSLILIAASFLVHIMLRVRLTGGPSAGLPVI